MSVVVDVGIVNNILIGHDFGRSLTKRGRENFRIKIRNDGGFEIGKKGKRGGLNKHKHLVLRVLDPEDWPEGIAERSEKEKKDLEQNLLPLNSNTGKGPVVGPGIPNKGDFFAVIDGEHRLAEFPDQYVAYLPFYVYYIRSNSNQHLST